MGTNGKKYPPNQRSRENHVPNKPIHPPTNGRKRRNKKKDQKSKENTVNDSGVENQRTIDFSKYAAGSAKPIEGGALVSIQEEAMEIQDRAVTPTVDNRERMVHPAAVATMTAEQKQQFIPIDAFKETNAKEGEESDASNQEEIEEGEDKEEEADDQEIKDSDNEESKSQAKDDGGHISSAKPSTDQAGSTHSAKSCAQPVRYGSYSYGC